MCKKLLQSIIFVLTIFTLVFVGCQKETTEEKPKESIVITSEVVELVIGEEFVVNATYQGFATGDIVYTIEDESVAIVDMDGLIQAVSLGETKLTATKGGVTDEVVVKVGLGELLPSLKFENSNSKEITIAINDFFDLSCLVTFGDANYKDASINYSCSNDVVKVENGILKPQKTGEVIVTATATWRNYSGDTLIKEIKVCVENNVELFVNDNMIVPQEEVVLYTYPEVSGKQYQTQTEFLPKAFENGNQIQAEVEIVSGDGVIEYNAVDGIVSSKKYGKAVIRVYCTSANAVVYEKFYNVVVKASIGDYKEVIDFSTLDGTLPLGKIFGDENAVIVEAYDENGAYEVKDNKILGVSSSVSLVEKTITVCTEQYGYNITIIPYTKILTKASDFEIFKIENTFANGSATVNSGLFDGYYILGNDIDAGGYIHQNGVTGIDSASNRWFATQGFEDCGLTGVFDGNGYTVSNLQINRHGIFGIINGGTVKNVAFDKVTLSGANCTTLCWYGLDAKIENVYINIKELPNVWGRTAISASFSQSVINNMILKIDSVLGNLDAGAYGSFTSSNCNAEFENTLPNLFTNVYIISNAQATITNKVIIDGENRDCENIYSGIKRYDSVEDMKLNKNYLGSETLQKNDFTSFETSGYWKTDSGIPIFDD